MGEVDSASFWQQRYDAGETRWDLGGPTPVFVDLWRRGVLTPGSMIVPGCGRGHDAVFFAQQGFTVTAVDFADSAVHATRERAAAAGVHVTVLQQDIFALDRALDGAFDYVLEYTCYCAIDPARRAEYARLVARLLRPGGRFVQMLFPIQDRTEGPPFAVTADEARRIFGDAFDLLIDEVPPLTVPPRKGRERLMIWRRKGGPAGEQRREHGPVRTDTDSHELTRTSL